MRAQHDFSGARHNRKQKGKWVCPPGANCVTAPEAWAKYSDQYLHILFQKSYPQIPVSLTTFRDLKPFQYRPVQELDCLCPIHQRLVMYLRVRCLCGWLRCGGRGRGLV